MIVTQNLTKRFNGVMAVDHLNLDVPEGVIYGFIGPNGAGKTTTIKMLATLLEPTEGEADINGHNILVAPEAVRCSIGYMPDFFGVYDDMKVWEYLDFFAAAFKIKGQIRHRLVKDVLELTDLTAKRDGFVETLSRGMKQRLCLARTLVHDPAALLLDEPASGLDPRARVEIRELLRELKRMGKTIFISSHILTELDEFCDMVGVIEQGKLLASGPIDEIKRRLQVKRCFEITVREDMEKARKALMADAGVQEVTIRDHVLQVSVDETHLDPGDLVELLVTGGYKVVACVEERADLEDLFMRITKGVVS